MACCVLTLTSLGFFDIKKLGQGSKILPPPHDNPKPVKP